MQKIWLVVVVCWCVQCDLFVKSKPGIWAKPTPTPHCPPLSFDDAAVFKTTSTRKEVGELFSVDITLTESKTVGDAYHRNLKVVKKGEDYARPLNQLPDLEKQLQDSASLVGGGIRSSSFDDGLAASCYQSPMINRGKVIDNGKIVRFDYLFYLEKTKTKLKLAASNNSTSFEIIANTGVTFDISLSPDASEYVLNITNGDASKEYQIAEILMTLPPEESDIQQLGDRKQITLDAEGKGKVRFSAGKVFEKTCQTYSTALIKASTGNNSRVVSKKVELSPCFISEDESIIAVTSDGSLTFTDKESRYCDEAKKITWSYAHSSDYSQLNAGGTLERVNPKADTIDLGTIADYDADACYLVVVKSACLDEEDDKPTRMKVGDGC